VAQRLDAPGEAVDDVLPPFVNVASTELLIRLVAGKHMNGTDHNLRRVDELPDHEP